MLGGIIGRKANWFTGLSKPRRGLVQVESGAGIITARKFPGLVAVGELSPNDAQSRSRRKRPLRYCGMLEKAP